MSKTAIVYTVPDCPRCDNAKAVLDGLGYSVETRDVDALVRGDYRDVEALTELTMNDGAVPVVVVEGQVVREGDDLYNLMKEHKEW